jgi:hypothetical protein
LLLSSSVALEPADQRVDFLLRGLEIAGRRHLASAQFAYGFLEDLGVRGHGVFIELTEEEVACFNAGIVATEAVVLDGGPLRLGTLRDLLGGLVRGLGIDDGISRKDTDGTRKCRQAI